MKLSGHTIFITGGGTGIGRALTGVFSDLGNQVIICGRRSEPLRLVKKEFSGVHYRVCNVSKAASRRGVVRWLLSRFNSLDILINNAGIQRPVDFLKGTRDLSDADAEIGTNLEAPIHLSALLIPHLRRKKNGAAIINISSGLAFTPLASVPVYCATKAALHSLSMSLRYQLKQSPIKVFEIAPPMVDTDLSGKRDRSRDDSDIMSPEEVAAGVLEAIKNDMYEVALGNAEYLRSQRDVLFPALNP